MVRSLYAAPGGAVVWLDRPDAEQVTAGAVEPWLAPIELERYREPQGDGVWVQMLSAQMRPLGAFRAALPPPGGRCALVLPVVRGTWWLLVLQHQGDDTHILGQLEVGPQLAVLVKKYPIPVQ